MSQDDDRILMTGVLRSGEPFGFIKFGDGEFECMIGLEGRNQDGQHYSREIGAALVDAWNFLTALPNVHMTCWCPRRLYPMASAVVNLDGRRFLDHDVLLLHRMSDPLADFYQALIGDGRRKIFVGPAILAGAAQFLKCALHIEVPSPDTFSVRKEYGDILLRTIQPHDIVLLSASFVAKVWAADVMKANDTVSCIDLGSAFDPIFIGPTRGDSPSREAALRFFEKAGLPI